MTTAGNSAYEPAAAARRYATGFWIVTYAYLIVMAFATLPSPLYGLYRTRDNLSAFTITVVFAIFAAGAIAALLAVPSLAARLGRRGVMLTAVATMVVSAGLLAAWKALPGLLIGRLITGIAVGLAAGTAITYLIELSLGANPNASVVRARTIGTAVTVGALGFGPLLAGFLAQWARDPLTVPYLLVVGLGGIALIGLRSVPETATPAPSGPKRRALVPLPAATATVAAFAANGLFAGLSGLLLATTFNEHSHALAGATLFIVFTAGVASQFATGNLRASRVLGLGSISMLTGLTLLVVSLRLSPPSLTLFLISGALGGAGAGAVFKGTTGLVIAAAPEDRLTLTSQLLIALYVGLSIPVIGAGIALDRGASTSNTVLGFAIVVGLGVAGAGWQLLAGRKSESTPTEPRKVKT
jgi:predicted MFS family arabinose efflux permease